jgi:hypothetical protein
VVTRSISERAPSVQSPHQHHVDLAPPRGID